MEKRLNGYKVWVGILATALSGLLVVTFSLIFDRSGKAYDLAMSAQRATVQNRQDIAVIKEKLSAIDAKLDERTSSIEKKIDELKSILDRMDR